MFTRRQLLQTGVAAGSGFVLVNAWGKLTHAATPSLDPNSIPKYVTSLVIPPAMPRTRKVRCKKINADIDYYEIAVRQFRQYILPESMGKQTTVWSYGSVNHPGSFNYPAFTIEAESDKPVRVKWINQLIDANGNYLPHLLPVDPTLHWANPPGGKKNRDSRPLFSTTPERYTGPVPIVTHLHGAHTDDFSDGYAEAWFLPRAKNIPRGYAKQGTWYKFFEHKFKDEYGYAWDNGTATFQYPNDQRAGTLWYHDHTVGLTRLNVYAGPAGFYILRGGNDDLPAGILPGPAPALGDAPGKKYYEIAIAIQDRSFNADGSLFYPDTRADFDEPPYTGPYIPFSDVPPIWHPEFFGNTMVVNGKTWPKLDVEPRRYRFRFLNGCDSRFLILKLVTDPIVTRPVTPILPFWQIGSEGGFLPAPAQLQQLLMSPAERADVIVDFTGLPVGTEVYLINEGPDEPFSGDGGSFADPNTTGQVMKFTVVPLVSEDKSVPPVQLQLPAYRSLGSAIRTRQLSLNEDSPPPNNIPVAVLLGTLDAGGNPVPQLWDDPITENPGLNDTEIWELYNFTVDAHPIHVHQVQFEVVNRQPFNGDTRSPEPWETGRKDTVIAYPGEITRIKATFDLPGNYVWHCHIVEHEDNEMMRPYRVGPYQKGAPEPKPYSDAPPNSTRPRQRRAVQRQRGILRQENTWDNTAQ